MAAGSRKSLTGGAREQVGLQLSAGATRLEDSPGARLGCPRIVGVQPARPEEEELSGLAARPASPRKADTVLARVLPATGVASRIAWLHVEALALESVWLVSGSGKGMESQELLLPPPALAAANAPRMVCSCRSGIGTGWQSFH